MSKVTSLLDVTIVLVNEGYISTAVGPIEVFSSAGAMWEEMCGRISRPRFRVTMASIDGTPCGLIVKLRTNAVDSHDLDGRFAIPSKSYSGSTVAARAYRALEEMLVTLELVPGSLTTETALVERTGLGRTPVREAIQRLAWEGFLEIRPRRGIEVAPVVGRDWQKMMEVRLAVEMVLARSAAVNGSRSAKERLRKAAHAMKQAVREGDIAAYLAADRAIDEAMGEASGNSFAYRCALPLQSHTRRFWNHFNSAHGLRFAANAHSDLVAAVLMEDEAEAARQCERLMAYVQATAAAALGKH